MKNRNETAWSIIAEHVRMLGETIVYLVGGTAFAVCVVPFIGHPLPGGNYPWIGFLTFLGWCAFAFTTAVMLCGWKLLRLRRRRRRARPVVRSALTPR